jgi:2',3'-cyclic-nucleotide 2'-phosphodiesterase (5'-nucleotidase family)
MLTKSLLKFTVTNLVLTSTILISCSTMKNMAINQKKNGHDRLYTYPTKAPVSKEQDQRYKRLIILGINDLNGEIFPTTTKIGQNSISSGGITGLKSYINIFRDEFKDSTLLLDSGSFISKNTNHSRMVFLYDYLGVNGVNLGLNEFTLNAKSKYLPSYLGQLFKRSKLEVISSNVFNLKEIQRAKWRNINRNKIFLVNEVKVGVLGMISQKNASLYFSKKLNGYYVQNMAKNIIVESNSLRKQGAEVIILMASHGIDCTDITSNNLNIDKRKVNFNTYDISGCESNENELVKTLSLLPPGKIDLVLSSGKNSKVSNVIHDIPVIQNYGRGEYLSWAEIYFDTKLKRVDAQDVFVQQPVQICHQFFKETKDCYIEDSDKVNTELTDIVPATLFGKEIKIEPLP